MECLILEKPFRNSTFRSRRNETAFIDIQVDFVPFGTRFSFLLASSTVRSRFAHFAWNRRKEDVAICDQGCERR